MTTLKMREDINLLEVENIFFLLLHRNVATGLSLFVGYEIDMTFFFHLVCVYSREHTSSPSYNPIVREIGFPCKLQGILRLPFY